MYLPPGTAPPTVAMQPNPGTVMYYPPGATAGVPQGAVLMVSVTVRAWMRVDARRHTMTFTVLHVCVCVCVCARAHTHTHTLTHTHTHKQKGLVTVDFALWFVNISTCFCVPPNRRRLLKFFQVLIACHPALVIIFYRHRTCTVREGSVHNDVHQVL